MTATATLFNTPTSQPWAQNAVTWFEIPGHACARARKAGGETLVPKMALPDGMGYFA